MQTKCDASLDFLFSDAIAFYQDADAKCLMVQMLSNGHVTLQMLM